MVYLRAFPYLALVVIAYNALIILGGVRPEAILTHVTLPSGAVWEITREDVFLIFGLALLFVEIVSASARTVSVVNHAFSLVLFIVCVVEFLLIPGCGTGTFLMIGMMTFIDVVAGYTISIRMARREYAIEKG